MLEDLQKFLNQEMHERNHRAVPELEGYSPAEMNQLLYAPFEESSPVEILGWKSRIMTRSPCSY